MRKISYEKKKKPDLQRKKNHGRQIEEVCLKNLKQL